MKLTSFFDDESNKTSKKIWQKPLKNQETFDQLSKQVLLKSPFLKKTKKPSKTKTRVYLLDED